MSGPELNRRARTILHAVVSEFLKGGEAVGSRTITRKHDIGLSAATVRNVMADLEELGLLTQPHTSAGRLPTENGLRFFIDSLLKVRRLTKQERQDISVRLGADGLDLDEIATRTSQTLAAVTPHAGIVLAPSLDSQRFRHIEFVRLRANSFLCVLVTLEGHIENRIIELDFDVEGPQLERIHNYLSELLNGLTLQEMRDRVKTERTRVRQQYDQVEDSALEMSEAALAGSDRGATVRVAGQANVIAGADLSDSDSVEAARDLLRVLEDTDLLVQLLDKSLSGAGIQVFLGAEMATDSLESSSVVVTPYGPEDRPIGAIAVVGPMRMNYAKVMSIVDFTGDLVSAILSDTPNPKTSG